jgi:hypothetical protein
MSGRANRVIPLGWVDPAGGDEQSYARRVDRSDTPETLWAFEIADHGPSSSISIAMGQWSDAFSLF